MNYEKYIEFRKWLIEEKITSLTNDELRRYLSLSIMREFKKECSEKEKENEIKKILDKYVVTKSIYDCQEMKII